MGHDEGADAAGALEDEDQGGRASRAEVLCVDRWVHPVLAEHLPADVDLEGRIRRVRTDDRAPQVLLKQLQAHALQARCFPSRRNRVDHLRVGWYRPWCAIRAWMCIVILSRRMSHGSSGFSNVQCLGQTGASLYALHVLRQ